MAPIPLGSGGLSGHENIAQVAPDELILAENISYEGGGITREGGSIAYNSTPLLGVKVILGAVDFFPIAGDTTTQRMIVYGDNGSIYKDSGNGSFSTTLTTGKSTVNPPFFLEAGEEAIASPRLLMIFNGVNRPQVLSGDGVVTTNLSSPAADWTGSTQPTCAAVHEFRVWAALKHRVYFSTRTNHQDFLSNTSGDESGSIAVYPGEGSEIVQILSFKGLLLIWKRPRGVYIIDTSGVAIADWKVLRLNASIGGVSSYGAVQIDNDILWIDESGGLQILSGVQLFDVALGNFSQQQHYMNPFIRDNLDFGYLSHIKAVYDSSHRECHIAWTEPGQTSNSARLVVDLNTPNNPKFRYSPRDMCESLFLRKDQNNIPRLACGGDTGTIFLLDQTSKSNNGADYLSQFQTGHLDYSFLDPKLGTLKKNFRWLELLCQPTGDWVLFCDILIDGRLRQTVQFNMDFRGAVFDTAVFDTDVFADDTILSSLKRRLVGSGRRLSLRFYQETALHDFSISKAFVGFDVSDESLRD